MGGVERTVVRLADALASQGVQVTMLTASWHDAWPGETSYHGQRLVRLGPAPRSARTMTQYLCAMSRWLRRHREQFDLVCVSSLRQEASVAVRSVGRSVPVVVRAEVSGPSGDCAWQAATRCGGLVRRYCRRAAAIVATEPVAANELIAAGYPASRIHPIANGAPSWPAFDPSSAKEARDTLCAVNVAFDIPFKSPLAVALGRFQPAEEVIAMIAAWRSVVARWPNARLWLVGEILDQRRLGEEIARRNLTNRVILTGPFDDLTEVFEASDLFVFPWQGGEELSGLLEAMAAGLPIVAVESPAGRAMAVDGREAILVPPGNAESMAAAMIRLLDGSSLGKQLGNAARDAANRRFPMAKMAEDHVRLFQSLLPGDTIMG
jgi:glycosyltransferase involved in cell wall biosynthesis